MLVELAVEEPWTCADQLLLSLMTRKKSGTVLASLYFNLGVFYLETIY